MSLCMQVLEAHY